ncbi:hypothetical protein BH695_0830 [Microcystis aeruginosa PCC 7806SL]|uniref:Uncharacterized protein n=1 Tax=Microcystis aeruginosa PCC 7806SL TaxID=1903187 RepID=A0AB33BMR5_MICA7|nr:hypothetical protein BH695_0830 [Microcystis aeruginosa PCC 7806SL]
MEDDQSSAIGGRPSAFASDRIKAREGVKEWGKVFFYPSSRAAGQPPHAIIELLL